jgi:hypothetical protein
MAEGKKSFLLYCDIITTIEKLSNEQAGMLFKTILEYVNDKNPVVNDIIIDLVFEPIKQGLKRDLKRYENICERNRANGAKGGRPESKPKKPNGIIGNPKKPKKADIDNDSDIDNDIDIDKEKDINIISDWRTDYNVYKSELLKVYQYLIIDKDFITKQEKYNPNVDISLSLEKAVNNYWITEAGWKKKKQSRAKEIDWKATLTNAIGMNKVYKQKYQTIETNQDVKKYEYPKL